jgi:hypothetical protein
LPLTSTHESVSPRIPAPSKVLSARTPPVVPSLMSTDSAAVRLIVLATTTLRSLRSGSQEVMSCEAVGGVPRGECEGRQGRQLRAARASRREQLGRGQRIRHARRGGAAVELGLGDTVRDLRKRWVLRGGRRRRVLGLGRTIGERRHAEGAGNEQGQQQPDQQPPSGQGGMDCPGLSWHGAPPAPRERRAGPNP